MDMFKWLEEQKSSMQKKPVPVLSYPGVQFLGASVKQLVFDADLQAKCMQEVAKRTDAAAAVSLMDLSVEAECFGAKIRFYDDEVPTVVGALIADEDGADALEIPSPLSCRASIYVDAIKKAKEHITDRPVLAGVIGPFSLAGRLVDVQEAMIYCYDEPDMMHVILQKCTDFLKAYMLEYKKAGANGVVMAEPLAGLLSPTLAEEFSEPYVKQIVDAVQDENFIVVYHNCGSSIGSMADGIYATGCKAYHFGNAVPLKTMLEKLPKDTVVMGNVDPVLFKDGTPEKMAAATEQLMQDCSAYAGFIPSSGCDIPHTAKWENIDAFFASVKKFYER